MDSTAF